MMSNARPSRLILYHAPAGPHVPRREVSAMRLCLLAVSVLALVLVNLPAAAISVIHRLDGSGTTFNWANYLSKVSPEGSNR